jgi:hypothetical protein
MIIALFPFRYPTIVDTEYFGGIDRHTWIWSMHPFPSINSTPLYLHNRCRIVPISFFNLPYIILRRFFGTHTIWYLHSHTVCDKLFFILSSFRSVRPLKLSKATLLKELFICKYYSIAFSTLTCIAGGLAL